jgi:16S rRNA (guanine1516-N2)-methyltransferase
VISVDDSTLDAAAKLAKRLTQPLFATEQGFFNAPEPVWPRIALVHTAQRLELRQYDSPSKQTINAVCIEPSGDEVQRRIRAGRKQPFARAIGLHKKPGLHVLDATAGLARDAMVLAGLGCQLSLLERNPVIHALIEDALKYATPQLQNACSLNACQNAVDYFQAQLSDACGSRFDAIYLDPMYPHERRKALPKKEMQLVRLLSGEDKDADQLLPLALQLASRVVVKRAPNAGDMAGLTPSHRIKSNRVRYDVYMAPI